MTQQCFLDTPFSWPERERRDVFLDHILDLVSGKPRDTNVQTKQNKCFLLFCVRGSFISVARCSTIAASYHVCSQLGAPRIGACSFSPYNFSPEIF